MDPGVEIALIVTCGTFAGIVGTALSQTVISRMTASQRREERAEDRNERAEDRKRRDAVAEQAAEAARLLLDQQTSIAKKASEAAALLVQNTRHVAEQSVALLVSNVKLEKKVDVVHGLVNSALTTVKLSEYDGLVRELALKEENIILRRATGEMPSKDTIDYMEVLQAKIADLKVELADRSSEVVVLARQKTEAAVEVATDKSRRDEDLGR